MSQIFNILIVEDQTLLRDTLKIYLEKERDFNIVETVSSGENAVKHCQKNQPDLIIMDIKMEKMSGLEATAIIKLEFPDIKILILTLYETEEDIIESILSGADGYLLKDIEPEIFISVLKIIMLGVNVYNKDILKKAYRRLAPLQENTRPELSVKLSCIELDIIKLICEGKQNKMIAEELHCSLGTVKNRIGSILAKTALNDRTQIVIYAIKQGLLT